MSFVYIVYNPSAPCLQHATPFTAQSPLDAWGRGPVMEAASMRCVQGAVHGHRHEHSKTVGFKAIQSVSDEEARNPHLLARCRVHL